MIDERALEYLLELCEAELMQREHHVDRDAIADGKAGAGDLAKEVLFVLYNRAAPDHWVAPADTETP